MALLKKIKASTLMETMVATVLIVVIFMIASLIINSLIAAQSKGNTQAIKEHIQKLEYAYNSEKLKLPYVEDWKNWEITVLSQKEGDVALISFTAVQLETEQKLTSFVIAKE